MREEQAVTAKINIHAHANQIQRVIASDDVIPLPVSCGINLPRFNPNPAANFARDAVNNEGSGTGNSDRYMALSNREHGARVY
jgi:hypothetical protein